MCAMRSSGVLQRSAAGVKSNIQEILQSGNYYVTEEIARELSIINNAIEHLSLDDTFLSTSKDWQAKPGNFTPGKTRDQLSDALAALNMTGSRLYEYKNCFANRNITNKQENQIRELHQWAVSSLKESQKDFECVTLDAADRIKQFGDTMGVTDRYTGYRQNLTRGTRDPFRMQTSWMDKPAEIGLMNNLFRSHTTIGSPSFEQRVTTYPPKALVGCGAMGKEVSFNTVNPPMRATRGYRTIDSLYPKGSVAHVSGGIRASSAMNEVKTINSLNACHQYERMANFSSRQPSTLQPYEQLSVQEQVGINTTFPGRTEYMHRYKAPDTDVATCDFLINPSPNFAIYGRPMQKAVYIPTSTEYLTRYDWPDAEKIVKLPWLRN